MKARELIITVCAMCMAGSVFAQMMPPGARGGIHRCVKLAPDTVTVQFYNPETNATTQAVSYTNAQVVQMDEQEQGRHTMQNTFIEELKNALR